MTTRALAFLVLLLPTLAFAQPVTVSVTADGELPGFRIAEAAPWIAAQMDAAHLDGWHFVPRDRAHAAPDRIEWQFALLPYAGGQVRQFFPMPGNAMLGRKSLLEAQVRLYLHGQYQTLTLGQETVRGGADDPMLPPFIARVTRNLIDGYAAIDMAPAHAP